MGEWVSVYADEPRLAVVPRSSDKAALAEILAANPDIGDEKEKTYLEGLIDGRFESVESEEVGYLLYAFQKVCETYSPPKATVEIYVEEEQFPEIFKFIYQADDPPVSLPTSSYGNPAVVFWPHDEVKRLITVFDSLDFPKIEAMSEHPGGYKDEIRELTAVLAFSNASGRGVYVFLSE